MLREIKRYRESQKGFTLIELMATLAILAMVVAIAVPAVGKIMDNAEAQAEQSSIALIESSGELAYLGGLEFDDTENERYAVPTLVGEGYLTLSEDDALYSASNFVERQSDGSFVFMNLTPNPVSDFTWSDNGDGTATITDYTGSRKDVIIPSSLDGLSVTSIGDYAFQDNNLTSVDIPDSVTSIGNRAFQNNELTSVDIPYGLDIISNSTFSNNKLTRVSIPDTVRIIESSAFNDNLLTSVTIPEGVEEISNTVFYKNKLTTVTLPDSVKAIKISAFGDNNITSAIIPETIESIHTTAFDSSKVSDVTIISTAKTPVIEAFLSGKTYNFVLLSDWSE